MKDEDAMQVFNSRALPYLDKATLFDSTINLNFKLCETIDSSLSVGVGWVFCLFELNQAVRMVRTHSLHCSTFISPSIGAPTT